MFAEFFSQSCLPDVNQAVADFVSMRIWHAPGRFGPCCTMGVFDGENLIGGIVYHNYDPDAGIVELSAGSIQRHWMTRALVRKFLSMPFERLGCQAVFARHPESSSHLRRIWGRFGAEEYVIPRLRGRNQPAECVAVLTQEAWAASPFMSRATKLEMA